MPTSSKIPLIRKGCKALANLRTVSKHPSSHVFPWNAGDRGVQLLGIARAQLYTACTLSAGLLFRGYHQKGLPDRQAESSVEEIVDGANDG